MNEAFHARLNDEYRLVIPAACRKQLGLQPGQEMLLQITDMELLLYTQDQAVKCLQDWCSSHIPAGVSLVVELISERHVEAARELDDLVLPFQK